MTVRVIGKATTERVTCPECLSILEYIKSDRKQELGPVVSGMPLYRSDPVFGLQTGVIVNPIHYIDCPSCGHKVML